MKTQTLKRILEQRIGSSVMVRGEEWHVLQVKDHLAVFELRQEPKVSLPMGLFHPTRILRFNTILKLSGDEFVCTA